ncbi:hypothetical protein NKG05_15950 [Oerskovia sp. M15]
MNTVPTRVSVRAQCWGEQAVVAVHTVNTGSTPIKVHAGSTLGEQEWADVAPGAAVYRGFESGVSSVDAGTLSVTATASAGGAERSQVQEVAYEAVSCGS